MSIDGKTYVDEVVRVVDLFTITDVLEGYSFTNCLLVGPAVLVIDGGEVAESLLEGDTSGLFWDLPQGIVQGAVSFRGGIFRRCRFQRIGFSANPPTLNALRASQGV